MGSILIPAPVTAAIKAALTCSGVEAPALTREQLIAGMEEIATRSAARPAVDPRSPDEIIGYDDFGLPR